MIKRKKTARLILVIGVIINLVFSPVSLLFAEEILPSSQETQTNQAIESPQINPILPTPPSGPSAPTPPDGDPITETITPAPDPTIVPGEDPNLSQPETSNNEDAIVPAQNQISEENGLNSNNANNNLSTNSPSDPQNSNTGANSDNTASLETDNQTNIENQNQAEAGNNINANANSGENEANYNTGNGSVGSGNANVLLGVLNFLNTNFVILPGGAISFVFLNIAHDLFGDVLFDPLSGEYYSLTGSRLSAQNTITGADSTNSAILNSNNETEIKNDNNGTVNNNFDLAANTGGNEASYNTGNGSVFTGDANISLNLLNFLNSSFTVSSLGVFGILNIFGSWIGDLILPKTLFGTSDYTTNILVNNQNTGANSTNDASASVLNSLDINNDNIADVNNDIDIKTIAGENTSSFNTGNGSVSSGDSDILLNLLTNANLNLIGDTVFFVLVNVLETWTGANLLPFNIFGGPAVDSDSNLTVGNSQTGANSENTAEANLSNSTDIENNNEGILNNNIDISANTGQNSANYNTGNGTVSSGDAGVIANILNFLNLNVVAKKFVFLVVNVFGSWTGNIDVFKNGNSEPEKVIPLSNQIPKKEGQDFPSLSGNKLAGHQSDNKPESIESSLNNDELTSKANKSQTNDDNTNLTAGSTSSSNGGTSFRNNLINFIKDNLKIIMFVLVVFYLIFLESYAKRKKRERLFKALM